MAPEAHGALVPADLDYGPKNMILPTKTGLSYMLYFINFLPSHMVEAVDAPKVYIYIYIYIYISWGYPMLSGTLY
jgi:hypothetical protein